MRGIRTGAVLIALALLVVGSSLWARSLTGIAINAPPLFGHFEMRASPWLLPAVAVAFLGVTYLPIIARRVSFGRMLVISMLASIVWAVCLALIDGPRGLLGALTDPHDYLAALPLVDGPGVFLRGFSDDLSSYPLHVQGHPPGFVLFLWGLGTVGLAGAWWAAAAIIMAGASATVAAVVAVRELAGEDKARRCVPFLVLIPAAIWVATSADAFFLGVSAWGIALFVLATRRPDRRGDLLAVGSGLLLGAGLFLSYGVAPLGLVVVAVAVARRSLRALVVAALGVGFLAAGFAALGFWWPDGLAATIDRYEAGIAARRPYGYFIVGNLAAFALALGPAVVASIVHLRDRRVWWLVGAALAAVLVADVSGFSKGEVERIWLPFVPWLAVATASLKPPRVWLSVQAVTALGIGFLVRTPW